MRGRKRLASRLLWVLVLGLWLTGCGDTSGPCDDYDPIGPCATSHGQTHGA